MLDGFEEELRHLHEGADRFARDFPNRDPYIDRLLEGVAYLTAQLRRHIDHDIPGLAECLLLQLCPSLLRPFPSTTIMEFRPRVGQLQSTYALPKGASISSRPVGEGTQKVECRFRTTSDIKINPLSISGVTQEAQKCGGTVLRLGFQADTGIELASLDLSGLTVYFHVAPVTALTLYHALTKNVRNISVKFSDGTTCSEGQEGLRIKSSHFSSADSLLPITGRNFFGLQLLQDYFACQEKYLFLTMEGLERIDWPVQCQKFEMLIHVRTPLPQGMRLDRELLRLHCAPAVNLFSCSSEPITLSHRQTEYPVIADVDVLGAIQIYSVDGVEGVDDRTGARRIYSPLQSFMHRDSGGSYYHLAQRINGAKIKMHYLSVGGHSDFNRETLSCTLTATNGFYPRRYLQEHSINVTDNEIPTFIECSNITRPTAEGIQPACADYRETLLSCLSFNYRSLMEIDTCKQMLRLLNGSALKENDRRIEGIREVTAKNVQRFKRGALMHGIVITLTLNEEYYHSLDDIYLFGMILHRFYSMTVTINHFVECHIHCYPSNREHSWEPLAGTAPIL